MKSLYFLPKLNNNILFEHRGIPTSIANEGFSAVSGHLTFVQCEKSQAFISITMKFCIKSIVLLDILPQFIPKLEGYFIGYQYIKNFRFLSSTCTYVRVYVRTYTWVHCAQCEMYKTLISKSKLE